MRRPPLEPPRTSWTFPSPMSSPEDLVCIGADLEPGTILAAYRAGLFPMPFHRRRLGWWSPRERGIIPLEGWRVSRSLRRSLRRYEVSVDHAFGAVMARCATLPREGGWITPAFLAAYGRLHELGWVHSVEAWTADGELAGGLYGVAIGGLFAGESMFHVAPDASKVALVALVEEMQASRMSLLDVQWVTPHLASLGAVAVPRRVYLPMLANAIGAPVCFKGGSPDA